MHRPRSRITARSASRRFAEAGVAALKSSCTAPQTAVQRKSELLKA